MKSSFTFCCILIALVAAISAGCSRFVITSELVQPIDTGSPCAVGAIADNLPSDMEESKKPSAETIQLFKNRIQEAILEERVFDNCSTVPGKGMYEITGSILGYKKGSQTVRALIGFGLGNSEVTTSLSLIETKTGKTLFAGNFKGSVSDWMQEGTKMFEQVAKDFAKALKKQQEKVVHQG